MLRLSGLIALVACVACGPGRSHVAPPTPEPIERWLATQPADGRWTIRNLSGHREVAETDDSHLVVLVDFARPTGLSDRQTITRESLQEADCSVTEPERVYVLDPEQRWVERALPESLAQVLEALANPSCARCVSFSDERRPLDSLDPTARVIGFAGLPSGGGLVGFTDGPLLRIERDGDVAELSGCPSQLAALAGPGDSDHYFAVTSTTVVELEIDEAQSRCRVTARYPAPLWRDAEVRLLVSRPEEDFEVVILYWSRLDPAMIELARFDGSEWAVLTTIPFIGGGERSLVRGRVGEFVLSNEFQMFTWRHGELRPVELPGGTAGGDRRRCKALADLDGQGVLASMYGWPTNDLMLRRPGAEGFEKVGTVSLYLQFAIPFRGGFVGVSRGGDVVEYHAHGGVCSVRTSLGQPASSSRESFGFADGSFVIEGGLVDGRRTLVWLHPNPLDPLPPRLF